MAGIGFELKKLFKSNSIVMKMRGASYATVTTVGPLIMVILTLFLMYMILGYGNVMFSGKMLLTSTLLYVFIFSLCTTAPLNSVLSRYIADKIYENREDDILPAYYSALALNVGISAAVGIPFVLWEFFVGKVNAVYVFASYCQYFGLVFVFYNSLFITAIKEYKKITYSFIIGLVIAFVEALILYFLFNVGVELTIIISLATGFIIIGFLLFSLVKDYFIVNSGNYSEVFGYMKEHWRLILTNSLYTLGLYVHNFVMWGTKMQVIVAKSYISAPIYDMATCIAMFINISTMVIFIVEVETNFHSKYQNYCQAVIGGTGADIEESKHELFRSIRQELFFIFQFQVVFTISLYLLAVIFLPQISISGLVMQILPTLAVAYFMIFLMYSLIIFLYYFNVYKYTVRAMLIFFGVTLVGTLISCHFEPALYGLGVLFGAHAGFSYAFYALKEVEKNCDYYIFCRGEIVTKIINRDHGQKIYDNKVI